MLVSPECTVYNFSLSQDRRNRGCRGYNLPPFPLAGIKQHLLFYKALDYKLSLPLRFYDLPTALYVGLGKYF